MINVVKKNNNLIIYWLLLSLFLVFSMIIVGGLTRLTDSGLSITEWELFKGIIPPLTNEAWIKYFNLYKEIPQYKMLNYSMDLPEFKIIFYWEYFHRILGRLIGIFFLIPLLYFHFLKNLSFKRLLPYYLILLLIIIQGFLGWYMVESGLVNNTSVSHFRLSAHLTTAILIISIIFWQILNNRNKQIKSFFNISKKKLPFVILILFLFLQITFGAFVSGLNAGKLHQTWPLMGYSYFPDDLQINKIIDLLNFNDHSLVQFYHRNIAYLISIYILILTFVTFKRKEAQLYKPSGLLLIVLFIQVFLGIYTLLSDLNIFISSAHQITSVILILTALNLDYYAIK